MIQMPSSRELRDAMLAVLAKHPHGLRTEEMDRLVGEYLNLSNDQRSEIRVGNRTELSYRLAWERTHAKKAGTIVRIGAKTWKTAN